MNTMIFNKFDKYPVYNQFDHENTGITNLTRQSEMANTSPCHIQVGEVIIIIIYTKHLKQNNILYT